MTLMMVAIAGVGFASCGGDDDDDSEQSAGSRDAQLVGTWYEYSKQQYGTEILGFTFENNGKAYYNEWNPNRESETTKDGQKFDWTTKDGILTLVEDDEYKDTESYKYVLSSDGKTLTLYSMNGNVEYTLTKQ